MLSELYSRLPGGKAGIGLDGSGLTGKGKNKNHCLSWEGIHGMFKITDLDPRKLQDWQVAEEAE